MIVHALTWMLTWLDWPEAMAIAAVGGSLANAWLSERRESRAEERRKEDLDELGRDMEKAKLTLKGIVEDSCNHDLAIKQLERAVGAHGEKLKELR